MMRDKNRRQSRREAGPGDWAIRNPELAELSATHQSGADISLVDISSEGIGIRTHQPIEKDSVISFDLCFSNAYHRVLARVLWTAKTEGEWRSGLQILQMPEDLMEEIEDYLDGIERRRPLN